MSALDERPGLPHLLHQRPEVGDIGVAAQIQALAVMNS